MSPADATVRTEPGSRHLVDPELLAALDAVPCFSVNADSLAGIREAVSAGHRQLGCRTACETRLSEVGGRDDHACLPELCRLPVPG